jgi:protein-S-isoprenylcysteine O-methyltransferase Ste14
MADPDHPRVLVPPPALYAGGFLLTLGLQWLWPAPILQHRALFWPGLALLILGLGLNLWGASSMIRARTAINTCRPVSQVVATGAFRVTRNPLYMGLNLVFAGLVLMLNTRWGILFLGAVLIVMHSGVIRREERYLASKFGAVYRDYCRKVRRYL